MKKTKWWVAFANAQNAIDAGSYDGQNCRTKQRAIAIAEHLVQNSTAIVAYAVKHQRTIHAAHKPKAILVHDGLKCSNWTPDGTLTFVPGAGI